jgi:hypothetical protein
MVRRYEEGMTRIRRDRSEASSGEMKSRDLDGEQ